MLPLLLALQVASAQPVPQPTAQTIVVVGQRIDDAAKDLAACLARGCKPDEDIEATLRLAETQLLAGKYRDARSTLLASLRRNRQWSEAYPVPVSELYRGNAKVAAHLGYDRDYYSSTFGIYRTLKHGVPDGDYRKYTSMMEVAEMMYRTRGHERARHYYAWIAGEARRAGRDDIAAIAELRSAIRHLPPGSGIQLAEIRKIANLQGKNLRAPVLEAKLALARIAYQDGDEAKAQAIQNELLAFNIKRPMLIYSPPYEMIARELGSGSEFNFPLNAPAPVGGEPGGRFGGGPTTTNILSLAQWSSTKRLAGNFDDMWVDVSFLITPEGKVRGAKITQSKGDLTWTRPLMISIAQRRYTARPDGSPNVARAERYTYTSGYEPQTGTRVAQRSPKARVEYIDLSDIASPE